MIKYLSAIILTFMFMVGPMSSSGMATMEENDEREREVLQSASATTSLSAITPDTAEETQISLHPLSAFMPQMSEAITVSIPFFQLDSSVLTNVNRWGLNQQEVDYLFKNSSDFIAFGGVNGFKKINKKLQEATAWSEEEFTSNPYEFFEHPDSTQKNVEYVKFAQKRLSTFGFESHTRRKDGSYLWIQWLTLAKRGTLVEADEDKTFFCIGRDITKPKEEEEARLKMLEQNQQEIKEINQNLTDQNKVLRALSDIQAAYIEKRDFPPREGTDEQEIFSGYYKTFEFILQQFIDLSESEYGFIGEVFYDEEHKPYVQQLFGGTAKDFAIDKKLQQIIKMHTGRGRKLCNLSNILGVSIATKKPFIINNVENYPQPTGIPQGHIPINSFLSIPFIFHHELVGMVALANRTEGYNNSLLQWLEPLFFITGHIMNELKLEQWHKEAERQSLARKHAEASSAAKSVFLAHISHEIRTPLTGMLGLLDLINKESLSEEDCTYLQTASMSGWSLMSLLNDVLDVSKIEAGQMKLEKIEFDPVRVIQEVIQLLSMDAKKQGIKLMMAINSTVPNCLIGDPIRLRQILFNLVGNAVKFTKQGSVSVNLDGQEDSEKKNIFCLQGTITDTGIGMTPEMQQHLFQPFSQADESMMRQFGGTGLGLYITKQLCEAMKGGIKASSQFGRGSTFQFTVKMDIPEECTPIALSCPSTKSEKLPKLHVLIAEDNSVNQLVLKTMLKREGCSTTVVANGREALEATQKEAYDLILMDGEMPEMDGLEATRRIRKNFPSDTLPIIGVTAHALDIHREEFLASGMNGYLTKPLKRDALKAEILRCLDEKRMKNK